MTQTARHVGEVSHTSFLWADDGPQNMQSEMPLAVLAAFASDFGFDGSVLFYISSTRRLVRVVRLSFFGALVWLSTSVRDRASPSGAPASTGADFTCADEKLHVNWDQGVALVCGKLVPPKTTYFSTRLNKI